MTRLVLIIVFVFGGCRFCGMRSILPIPPVRTVRTILISQIAERVKPLCDDPARDRFRLNLVTSLYFRSRFYLI